MFRSIDFQNIFYCNIFAFYVCHLEKVFADMSQSCASSVFMIKIKMFGKVHIFQKKKISVFASFKVKFFLKNP